MEWTCAVEAVNDAYVGDVEDLSDRVLARLASHHGSVAFGDRRIVARFTVDSHPEIANYVAQNIEKDKVQIR